MKRVFVLLLGVITPFVLFAAEQTITMKVDGACGSCKKRIIKAAKTIEGVDEATWDKETKTFTAKFDDSKASKDLITKAILKAGYDVEDKKALDEDYNKLPDCCQYR